MIGLVLVCTWTVLFLLGWFGFGWYLDGLLLVYTFLGCTSMILFLFLFVLVCNWLVLCSWFCFDLYLNGFVLNLVGFILVCTWFVVDWFGFGLHLDGLFSCLYMVVDFGLVCAWMVLFWYVHVWFGFCLYMVCYGVVCS